MLYHRPLLSGGAMLAGAVLLGVASGVLFVNGVFAALERPLTAWYHANNH